MHSSRLGTGDLIAGAGGALLLVSLFLPWYGAEINVAGFEASGSVSGWEAMGFIDVLLAVLAIVAVGVTAARAAGSPRAGPQGPAPLVVAGALALALVLVLFRLIDVPLADVAAVPGDSVEIGREPGVLVALVAAAAVAYGGFSGASSIRIAAPPADRAERHGAPAR